MRIGGALLAATCLLRPTLTGAQTFSIADPENTGPSPEALAEAAPPRFQTTLFRGAWRSRVSVDTAHEDRCGPTSCEDVFDIRNEMDLRLQTELRPGLTAVVEGRFDHRVVGERPPGRTFTVANAERVKGVFEAQLREAFLRVSDVAGLDLTLGQQVVAWGVLDTASAQDVVNPVDYRSGMSPGHEPPRIPVFALRLETRLGPLHVDGVFAPFFTPHRIDLLGSDFGPVGSSAAATLGGDVTAAMLGAIDASVEDEWSRALQASSAPMDLPGSSDAGLRVGASVWGVDLHAAYLFVWDRLPEMRPKGAAVLATGGLPFESTYSRRHVLGGDATVAAGDFVVRLETGWSPSRTLYEVGPEGAPTPTRRSVTLSGLGVDWSRDTDWMVSLEGFWMRVNDVPDDAVLLLIEPDLYGAAGGLTSRWLEDDLSVSLRGMVTSLEDVLLFPEVAWRISEGHEVAASVEIYAGAEGSPGRQFDHNDQGSLCYTLSF